MGAVGEVLDAARDAYRRHEWAAARKGFSAARTAGELAADDLDALADASWWLGEAEEASAVLEEAYRRHLNEGRPGRAAMSAIGVAVNHLLRGDGVVGSVARHLSNIFVKLEVTSRTQAAAYAFEHGLATPERG